LGGLKEEVDRLKGPLFWRASILKNMIFISILEYFLLWAIYISPVALIFWVYGDLFKTIFQEDEEDYLNI